MDLMELDKLLRELLSIDELPIQDASLNGLQVSRTNSEIKTVAFAVDACLESFRKAVDAGADMLFVHHGLLWSKQLPLRGSFYQRIKYLMDHDLALYGVHLPLDMHPELGNNSGIANALGLEERRPFARYHGLNIGVKGVLPEARGIDELITKICAENSKVLGVLPFGPEKIRTVGISSGGDPLSAFQAMDEGLDLFVTGDSSHQIYHPALEGRLNVVFAGHYTTEIWGVRNVARHLADVTDLKTIMLDVPTGL